MWIWGSQLISFLSKRACTVQYMNDECFLAWLKRSDRFSWKLRVYMRRECFHLISMILLSLSHSNKPFIFTSLYVSKNNVAHTFLSWYARSTFLPIHLVYFHVHASDRSSHSFHYGSSLSCIVISVVFSWLLCRQVNMINRYFLYIAVDSSSFALSPARKASSSLPLHPLPAPLFSTDLSIWNLLKSFKRPPPWMH